MDGDLWKDHPVQQQVAEPSSITSLPAMLPEEGTSKGNLTMTFVGDLMAGERERKRREVNYKGHRVYKCTLGEK